MFAIYQIVYPHTYSDYHTVLSIWVSNKCLSLEQIRDAAWNSVTIICPFILFQVVDGERFKISIPPEVGTKTHTNPHKKIAYVTMKDTEFTYPSTDLFEEILQTERPVKEAANLLEEGYVKGAEETPRLKSWKIAVFARRGE